MLIGTLVGSQAFSQEFPLHTQYMYNRASINPGYVGVKGKMSILLFNRLQWAGLNGGPITNNISIEYPFQRAAYGLSIKHDQAGPLSNFKANAQFGYNIELGYYTFLSLGVSVAGAYNQFDINKLKIKDQGEAIFSKKINEFGFDIGAGAFLYGDNWYFGVSSPNLNLQKYYRGIEQNEKRALHTYAIGGYSFDIDRSKKKIQPSFMVRYIPNTPISADFSVNFQWNESFLTGLAYRLNSAYSLLLGFNVSRQLHLGYSFDWDQSRFYKTNYGSHEFFLRYDFTREDNTIRFQSPRFF